MVFAFSIFSCGPLKHSKKETCVCMLIDISQSTQKKSVRQNFSRAAHQVVQSLAPGDAFVAGLITQMSLSEPKFCAKYEFKKFQPPSHNSLYDRLPKKLFDLRVKSIKDSLTQLIDSTLFNFNTRVKETEILGATRVAARVFQSYRYPNNVLVILSDMIEDSKYYRFNKIRFTPKTITRLIEKEKEKGRLPDLTGVRVYVVGAYEEKPYESLRDFWMAYFKACHAELRPENYGAILVAFRKNPTTKSRISGK